MTLSTMLNLFSNSDIFYIDGYKYYEVNQIKEALGYFNVDYHLIKFVGVKERICVSKKRYISKAAVYSLICRDVKNENCLKLRNFLFSKYLDELNPINYPIKNNQTIELLNISHDSIKRYVLIEGEKFWYAPYVTSTVFGIKNSRSILKRLPVDEIHKLKFGCKYKNYISSKGVTTLLFFAMSRDARALRTYVADYLPDIEVLSQLHIPN